MQPVTLPSNEGSGLRLCKKSVSRLQYSVFRKGEKKEGRMERVFNLETGRSPDIAYHYKGENVYITP